ncbi:AAA family ATPase [Sphingomonas morindae]|uniref:AAA family ATPase n=1 Tax=Sphingomonas morindae TaxID=1541170 RepID=A0ABY4XAM6_9SPHN|nr:AAA family ATPase [Sphingomonas morindae]USI73879.1 AAA family ATPase [Sphingomonas morindae]
MLNLAADVGRLDTIGMHRVDATHDFRRRGAAAISSREKAAVRDAVGRKQAVSAPDRTTEKLWDSEPGSGRWLAHLHVGSADPTIRYRIDGWLAEVGTSVWFGAGSTGKTQLMLWMAAMLASQVDDRPQRQWLGGDIHGTGHVLILSAEDTRDQIIGRLRDVLQFSMGQDHDAQMRTSARLHVMPFLSMPEEEFGHPNSSLFWQTKEREWVASAVMDEVREYISKWNEAHPSPEDRIIGVVMDSATSMSGFDSMDAQATTNFFFHLGRLCESLRIFWAIIGHTPKTTTISEKTYRASAASRLRGVAMWTTAPRLVVEVRLVQDWGGRRKVAPEAEPVRKWLGKRFKRENLLVVYVAKANLKGACTGERFLARQRHGAFVDVTDMPDHVLESGALDGWESDDRSPTVGDSGVSDAEESPSIDRAPREERTVVQRRGRRSVDAAAFGPGTDLVREVLQQTYPAAAVGTTVSANRLKKIVAAERAHDPRSRLVKTAHGGGSTEARPGAINWHLDRLAESGLLEKDGRMFRFAASDLLRGGGLSPDG